jgi:plasmid stabilization system protein ParE
MVHKVTFTKTADKTFYEIAQFLEENASRAVAIKFAEKVDFTIEKLIKQPFIGRPSSKAKTVRKINVNKNVQMMYRVVGRTLIISNFFDTRQHPGKSRF